MLHKSFQGKLLHSVLDTTILESSSLKGEKKYVLKVPSSFHQQILKNHLPSIQNYIKKKERAFKTINIQKVYGKQPLPPSPGKTLSPPIAKKEKPSVFSQHWTFSSFIQGPGNCFALSLAKSIAQKPFQNNINPFFIYGPSGIGKTHLLHAIGNYLEKENTQIKTRYLPAERFFNDCINHIRKNEMGFFRQKYRSNLQVLLLDDVQILGKGESIQEEFFHTFESLKQNGCQIVLVSDQKPSNIKGLKERIKTRFEGGVIAEMEAPDKDTKIAIIKNKSQKYQIKLSEEIIFHIANIHTHSVRELEGHLNKIKMFCELQNKPASLALVQSLFKDIPTSPGFSSEKHHPSPFSFSFTTNAIKIRQIQKEVCNYFHIKLSEIKSHSRSKNLVLARNIAIYIIRKDLPLSLTEIGWHFGKRNHSTILNSLKKLKNQQQKNYKITSDIKYLQNTINKKTAKTQT